MSQPSDQAPSMRARVGLATVAGAVSGAVRAFVRWILDGIGEGD
jgi:hypothetical protein